VIQSHDHDTKTAYTRRNEKIAMATLRLQPRRSGDEERRNYWKVASTAVSVEPTFDQAALRRAYGLFPSGVTAVCGMLDGEPTGMAASSFTTVSLDPALVSVCVSQTSTTWPKLRGLSRLGVSVLAEDHGPVATSLAEKDGDRFTSVNWEATELGAILVHGSTLWLECTVENEVPAGDHNIVVMRIQSLEMYPEVAPMIFHGSNFRRLAPVPKPL
jgi:flavin reductase (DIM6/NTAB) family NADH-FMN oxidoreductase RutF